MTSPDRTLQRARTPDRRALCFAEYGDPAGPSSSCTTGPGVASSARHNEGSDTTSSSPSSGFGSSGTTGPGSDGPIAIVAGG
jgi:hypothetical protein